MSEKLILPAVSLLVSDKLVGSNRTVTHEPQRVPRQPSKVYIGIDGVRRTWGTMTKIGVTR